MKDKHNNVDSVYRKNTIYNALKTLSTIIFPLITFPYVSRIIGPDKIGKIYYSLSISNYFILFASLGISTYGIRECGKVRKDKKYLNQIASELYTINLFTSIITFVFLLIACLSIKSIKEYSLLIIIQSAPVFFNWVGADWINSALEDFRYITIRTFFFQLIAMISVFCFIKSSKDYIVYCIINVIAICGTQVVNVFHRRKLCSLKIIRNCNVEKHIIPILFMFAMLLSQQIYSYIDITIIGAIKGDYSVGLYSTVTKIISIIAQVIASITWVVLPQMSSAFEKKNYNKINELVCFSSSYSALIGFPCIVGIIVFSREIIELVAGKEFCQASVCFKILAISMLCSCISNITGNEILLSSGKERQFMISCVVGTVINVFANLIMIPQWGINAAAFTTFVANFIIVLLTLKCAQSEVFISMRNIVNTIKAPIIGSLSVLGVCLVLRCLIINKLMSLIIAIPVCGIVYFVVLVVMKDTFVKGLFNRLGR